MSFFKWYGGLQRKMLSRFDHLFVQNKSSKELVDAIGLADICTVSGDTRFDRVIAIAENFQPIPAIEQFINNHKTIIAGSTWAEDEEVLQKTIAAINDPALRLIIAPHEINKKRLTEIKEFFPDSIFYSDFLAQQPALKPFNCLIIDNIGMLSKLYKYSYISYVGGALKINGVHNVLEAAVYNKVVLFGPYYKKYSEAIGLIESGGGISFDDADDCKRILERLLKDDTEYNLRSKEAGNFVHSNKGATEKIIQFIQEKRLLTS